MNKTFILKPLVIALLAAGACGSAFAADPIRIAVICPYSTGYQDVGLSVRNGVTLAAAEINNHGGILGRPVELVKIDDFQKVDGGKKAAQAAIERDHVVAGIAYCNSGVAQQAFDIWQKAGVPVISGLVAKDDLLQKFYKEPVNYVFRNAPADGLQTTLVVEDVVKNLKLKKVAIFADSSPYGQGGLDLLLAKFAKYGIKPVTVARFAPGTTNFTKECEEARKAGADVIVPWALSEETAQIAFSQNLVGMRLQVVGSWNMTQKAYSDRAPVSDGARMPISYSIDSTRAKAKTFLTDFRTFHVLAKIPSPMAAAQGYDTMNLLARAIEQAKSTDGKAMVNALENLQGTYVGVTQDYTKPFSHANHEAFTSLAQMTMGVVHEGNVYKTGTKFEDHTEVARREAIEGASEQ